MKKLFFALAFMLIGSFAFANSNEKLEKFSLPNLETVAFDNLTTSNYTFSFNDNQITNSDQGLADCTLKGKFTITFSDGSSYTWEGTLTIVGQSCVEFLKELMKN